MDVHQYAEKAANLYQQHGSPEAAASALDKAAKMLETDHPEKALLLYQHALDVVMVGCPVLYRLRVACYCKRVSPYSDRGLDAARNGVPEQSRAAAGEAADVRPGGRRDSSRDRAEPAE